MEMFTDHTTSIALLATTLDLATRYYSREGSKRFFDALEVCRQKRSIAKCRTPLTC